MKETKRAYALILTDIIIMTATIVAMIVLIAALDWNIGMAVAACLGYLVIYTLTLVLLIKALFLLIKVDNKSLDFYWRLFVELGWCVPFVNVIVAAVALIKVKKSMEVDHEQQSE